MKRMDGKDLTSTTFMNTMFNKNVDCHPTPSVLRFSVLLNKVWDLVLVKAFFEVKNQLVAKGDM